MAENDPLVLKKVVQKEGRTDGDFEDLDSTCRTCS